MTAHISFTSNALFTSDIAATTIVESQELIDPEQLQIFKKIVQHAGALLEASHCSLALVDASNTAVVTLAALLPHGQQPRRTRFRFNEGVAGWVAAHRCSLLLNHAEHDPRFKRLGSQPIGSILCVPLLDQQQLLGTLTVSSTQVDCFDEQKQRILEILAEQAVQTIVHARQTAIAQQQARQREMLFHLSRTIVAHLDPETLYGTVLNAIQRVAPCRQATIYLTDENARTLVPVAELNTEQLPMADTHNIPDIRTTQFASQPIDLDNEQLLPSWASRHRHPMLRAPFRSGDNPELFPAELAVPLLARNTLYGVIWLTRSTAFHSDEFRLVRHISSMTTAALENRALLQKQGGEGSQHMQAGFLSKVAHELRSPINTINGYLDLALEGVAGDLNEQQHEFIRRARSGSEHLYALLEDLLLIARADTGQLQLNRAIMHLADVIENAIEEMELTASDNGVAVEVEIAPNLPRVYGDAIRLQQVIRNLLNNALRFTPAGGHVTISARLAEQSGTDEEGGTIELLISDTGAGIEPEKLPHIFDRFVQAVPGSRGRTGGHGLAIVKMVVELHGGAVTVKSVPGEGSTFVCTLPCLLA
jgi:signal transduction histidine kinase